MHSMLHLGGAFVYPALIRVWIEGCLQVCRVGPQGLSGHIHFDGNENVILRSPSRTDLSAPPSINEQPEINVCMFVDLVPKRS
jgi:hypothetical protein